MYWRRHVMIFLFVGILCSCGGGDSEDKKPAPAPSPKPTSTDDLKPAEPVRAGLPETSTPEINNLNKIAESFPTLAKTFSIPFSKKIIYAASETTLNAKEGITQLSDIQTEPQLTPANKLTITQQEFKQLANWDRLERDRLILSNTYQNENDFTPLVNEEIAKVLVIDSRLNPEAKNNYDDARVKHEVYIYEDNQLPARFKNNPTTSNFNLSHGNSVLHRIIGKGLNNTPASLGILNQKGSIYFIGGIQTHENVVDLPRSLSERFLSPAFSRGYKIVNLSLASYSSAYEIEPSENFEAFYITHRSVYEHGSVMRTFKKYITQKDGLFVIATGNIAGLEDTKIEDQKRNLLVTLPVFSQTLYGEDFSYGLLAVSAHDPSNRTLATFAKPCGLSKTFCLVADGSVYIPVSRESGRVGILAARGTSFAAPYVASVAALTKSVFPFMRNRELQQTLLTTATDLGDEGIDDKFGWGAVNPLKAIAGPAQFYGKDFEVDLTHDLHYQTDQAVYRFSNDISGKYGLIVIGNAKQNVLSLSGLNHYEGDTVLKENAIVNIDGYQINSDTIVNTGATLYGSGRLRSLSNSGQVNAYSYFKETHPNEIRSQYGMQAEQYYQSAQGSLAVYLGMPFWVHGAAQIDGGVLDIKGIQSAFINSKKEVSNYVLIAQSIGGNFERATISTPLLTGEAVLSKQSYTSEDDQTFDTIAVKAQYQGLSNATRSMTRHASREVLAGATVLDHLIDRLSDDETDENHHDGLYRFASTIQSLASIDEIENTTIAFSGKAHQESLQFNQLINDLSHVYFLRNLQTGIQYLSNPMMALLQFQKQNLKLQITQAHDETNTALGKHRVYSLGAEVGLSLPIKSMQWQLDLAYYHNQNRDSYTKTIGKQASHFYQRYTQSQWSMGLSVQKTWQIAQANITPILGIKLAYIDQDAYQEQYDQVQYEVSRHRFYLPQIIAGLSYRYHLSKDWDMRADYTFLNPIGSHALPIKFKSASQSYTFEMHEDLKATHHLNVQVQKQFKHISAKAGVYATYSDRWRTGFSLGLGAQF